MCGRAETISAFLTYFRKVFFEKGEERMILQSTRVWVLNDWLEAQIEVSAESGRIEGIYPWGTFVPDMDFGGLRVIPGLIDVHTHGAYGFDTNDAEEQGLKNWLDKTMDTEEDRREARLWKRWEEAREAAGEDRLVNRGYELTEEPWRVELKAAGEDRFRDIREIYAEAGMTPEGSGIGNLLLQKPTARFSGTVRYTLDYTPELGIWRELVGTGSTEEESAENGAFLREERLPKAAALLRLGVVGEIAEVFVNGVSAGVKVNYPYDFPVGHLLKPGVNHFEVVVTNTLVYQERDYCSESMPLEPSGLAGPVDLVIMGAG
jgi:hypothetical protein